MTLETIEMVELTTDEDGEKKRKKKQNIDSSKRVKPPTAEEMNKLRETENLFLSNMFRLQIDEMLKEVKPKQATLDKIKEWFDKFTIAFVQDMDTSNYKKVHLFNLYEYNVLVSNLIYYFGLVVILNCDIILIYCRYHYVC